MLDRALPQMVEHLIASGLVGAGDLAEFVEIVHVEIADAPRQDLAVGAQPLEGGDRIAQEDASRASGADSNRVGRS